MKKVFAGSFVWGFVVFMLLITTGYCEDTASLVLLNGLLIDGTGTSPVPNAVLIVEQDRIVAVGPADTITIPEKAKHINLQGAAILPGFINAHVHSGYMGFKLKDWAKNGVTTVRDLGSTQMDGQWFTRRDALLDDPTNARLVAVGPFVTVPGGYPIWPWRIEAITVTSPEDARKKTEQLLQKGADLIKIAIRSGKMANQMIPVLTPEETRMIVKVAHQHGKKVTAHITYSVDLKQVLDAGVDDIAHMVMDELSDTHIAEFIKQDVYWVPTLELWYHVQQQYAPRSMPHQIAVSNLRRLVQAGGASKIALGTDYAGYNAKFELGISMLEIESMQEAGMTPMQIIMAATKHAAHVCNMEQEIGTLEAGKIADILVVKQNPLEDLHALKDIALVIHNGVIVRN